MYRLNIFLEHIYEACGQRNIPVGEMLREAHNMGYTGLECDINRLSDRAQMKELFDDCEMNAASVYAFFDFPHDEPGVSLEKMLTLLETAAYFGAEKVLAVPGFYQPGDDIDKAYRRSSGQLEIMCRRAAEYGIAVTVEDFDDANSPCCGTEGLLRLLKGTEGLRFTFDTGNFAYANEDTEQSYELLKPYISHVHLKDRSYDSARAAGENAKADLAGRFMYPCEAGEGCCNIERLVKRLITDGYRGDFSVEHFGAADQYEYMRKSAENVRRWIKEVQL